MQYIAGSEELYDPHCVPGGYSDYNNKFTHIDKIIGTSSDWCDWLFSKAYAIVKRLDTR